MLANEIEMCFIETLTPPYGFDPVDCCICHKCFWWRRPSKRIFRLVTASLITCITDIYILLESLNKQDGDSNGNGKTETLHVHHTLCTFLCRHCRTTTWKCLISRSVDEVYPRQRFSFPFPELRYSFLEFNSRKICQALKNRPFFTDTASILNLLDLRREYYGMPREALAYSDLRALFRRQENFNVNFSGKRRSLLHRNTAQRSFFPIQCFSRKTWRKIGPQRARKYWASISDRSHNPGHLIILLKSNQFNMAAVSVKRRNQKRDKVWSRANSLFKWRYHCRRHRSCLRWLRN